MSYKRICAFFFLSLHKKKLKTLQKSCEISGTDQFQHPWTSTAGREAAEQPEDDDDSSGPNKDIWCIGAFVWSQKEIKLQINLSPYSNSQQDHSCELQELKTLRDIFDKCL